MMACCGAPVAYIGRDSDNPKPPDISMTVTEGKVREPLAGPGGQVALIINTF